MRALCGRIAPAIFVLSVVGCGGSSQEQDISGTVVTTHTQNVRSWLEGVAQSGQLDSGAMLMKDEIAQLKGEGVEKADELQKDLDELLNMKNPAQIRSKASAMAAKLPPPPTVSRTEEN